MAAKRKPFRSKRKTTKVPVQPSPAASVFAMATHNVVNMIAVTAVSGSVLLTLLAIKHF